MVVDIGFTNSRSTSSANFAKRAVQVSTGRPQPHVVNYTGAALRERERLAERRRNGSAADANFKAAMESLATANADIDRLNAELSQARIENGRLKAEAAETAEKTAALKDEVSKLKAELQKERAKKGKGKKSQPAPATESASETVATSSQPQA